MSSGQSFQAFISLLIMGMLASCAGSSLGDNVQQSLEADPQLEETSPFQTETAATESPDEANTDVGTATEPISETSTERDLDAASRAIAIPRPGDADFIGPVWLNPDTIADASNGETDRDELSRDIPDLSGLPADLQPYVEDLQALGVIDVTSGPDSAVATAPYSQSISRQEYARWLFDSYNTIYADEPGERLRAGSPADEPAFQDLSPDNPAYGEIQGLAEAGIIPSAFTGSSTDINFRPDAPLTRADLILWKVPLDTQAALPTTTPDTVSSAWGFQDIDSISPLALRAIAADFQLGDFANIRRAFGYTTLFRPEKTVSRAEAAAVLWRFGTLTDGYTAADQLSQRVSQDSDN
jgi:hypothetical protein